MDAVANCTCNRIVVRYHQSEQVNKRNMEQIYTPNRNYKVLVTCKTYNQAKYIEDALNGFAMQKTDFPFVCLVVDDCSSDGEQNIIKAWMEHECEMAQAVHIDLELSYIIIVPHKTNPTCMFAFYLLKKNMYCKPEKGQLTAPWRDHCEYEALCEGDDYWIAGDKLQKQVDFMDTHKDFGLIHTEFDLTEGVRRHNSFIKEDGNYWPEAVTRELNIGTLTVLYRMSTFEKLPKHFKNKKWLMGDKPLWIEFAKFSKIKYYPFITARYRVLSNSASHSQDIQKMIKFKDCAADIAEFYATAFGVSVLPRNKNLSYHEDLMKFACRLSDSQNANIFFSNAVKNKMISMRLIAFYCGAHFSFIKKFIKKYSAL